MSSIQLPTYQPKEKGLRRCRSLSFFFNSDISKVFRVRRSRFLSLIMLLALTLFVFFEPPGQLIPFSDTDRSTPNTHLERVIPPLRPLLSPTSLNYMTGKNSSVPSILFSPEIASRLDLSNFTIPKLTIPVRPPVLENYDTVDMEARDENGDRISLEHTLDGQYWYTNQIKESMDGLLTEYPFLKHARANACIFILCRNSDLSRILFSMSSFEFAFNRRYNYPYVLLNDEPFSDTFEKRIREVTNAKVEFGIIPKEHWSVPDDVTPEEYDNALEQNKDKYQYGGSRSYRLMCRYQSRFFYRHPLLLKYRYYWRVEPNVMFKCEFSGRYDPLLFMALSGKRYGFTILADENMETIKGLWNQTLHFMRNEKIPMSPFFYHGFYNSEGDDYNGRHFWSNFEIADMEFYRSDLYERYMDALDETKGFFLHRYGDAPIHTLAAAMLLPPDDIHHFADISYYHDGYGTCPRTNNETLRAEFEEICWCERKDGFWAEETWWATPVVRTIGALNQWKNFSWGSHWALGQ